MKISLPSQCCRQSFTTLQLTLVLMRVSNRYYAFQEWLMLKQKSLASEEVRTNISDRVRLEVYCMYTVNGHQLRRRLGLQQGVGTGE